MRITFKTLPNDKLISAATYKSYLGPQLCKMIPIVTWTLTGAGKYTQTCTLCVPISGPLLSTLDLPLCFTAKDLFAAGFLLNRTAKQRWFNAIFQQQAEFAIQMYSCLRVSEVSGAHSPPFAPGCQNTVKEAKKGQETESEQYIGRHYNTCPELGGVTLLLLMSPPPEHLREAFDMYPLQQSLDLHDPVLVMLESPLHVQKIRRIPPIAIPAHAAHPRPVANARRRGLLCSGAGSAELFAQLKGLVQSL